MRSALRIMFGLSLALTAAACGAGGEPPALPTPGGSPAPAGSELVFRMQDYNGFVPPGTPLPMPLVVYRDGRIIQARNTAQTAAEQMALPKPVQRRLTPAGLQRLLQGAIDAGLTTTTEYGEPGVIDIGPTKFTVVSEGRIHTVTVEGADFPSGMIDDPRKGLRERLMAFRKQLADLDSWLGADISATSEPYTYTKLAVSNRQLGEGETAPEFAPVKPWPFEISGRCAVMEGEKLTQAAKLASETNAYAAWSSNNKLHYLEFRPLLPEETGCESVATQ